jgi:hypothetical protein
LPEIATYYLAVQKQQRTERLVLCGSTDALPNSEMGQEGHHIGIGQFGRMGLTVEQDVASNPPDISLFGATAVMLPSQRIADLVQNLRRPRRYRHAVPSREFRASGQ